MSRCRTCRAIWGATLSEIGWVITGYSMANVVIIPLTAWLDERFGRKRYFIFSLVPRHRVDPVRALDEPGDADFCARAAGARRREHAGQGAVDLFQTFSKAEQGAAQAAFGLSVIAGPAIGPTLAAI